MTGQNEAPKNIVDDTEGRSAKAFGLDNDPEGCSASGRFGTDDVAGHSAKAVKADDAEDDSAGDDTDGHSLKIG